jgi:N-glycosylase/DNA lyase
MKKGELKAENLNLDYSFSSGQIFRWHRIGDYWIGICYGSLVALRKRNEKILYKIEGNIEESELKEFLGFEQNEEEIKSALFNDDLLKKLYFKYYGLRLLKQNKRECILSFLSASFNNIKRANRMLEELSKFSKRKLKLGDIIMYDYPNFTDIIKLKEKDLRKIGYGFRARYILDFINKFKNDEELEELNKLSTKEIHDKLMEIKGIGLKTANCITLYSYSRFESFPIDTWMIKAIIYFYSDEISYYLLKDINKNYNLIKDIFNKKFKNYAGYAQLFIYKYIRDYFKQLQ